MSEWWRTEVWTLVIRLRTTGPEPKVFTEAYQALAHHYGFISVKTQPNCPHENGDVEQRHHRLKKAVEQALLLRGSRDFSGRQEYENFLQKLFAQLNAGRAQRLREELKVLRELPARRQGDYWSDRERVQQALDDWCEMAGQIDHPAIRAFIKQLRFFAYGILNHADYPIGTSRLEGINNKIKVIKRKAYGFHDDYYFVLKVKQACAA